MLIAVFITEMVILHKYVYLLLLLLFYIRFGWRLFVQAIPRAVKMTIHSSTES